MQIKKFEDGTILEMGRGRFDDYCVYLKRFKSRKYSSEKIYNDYVTIYEKTTSKIDYDVLEEIEEISMSYDEEDRLDFCIWYSVIYLGMVAEENKAYAVLKKRIKRLGMYQILFEKMLATEAATFSIGKKVAELKILCSERKF